MTWVALLLAFFTTSVGIWEVPAGDDLWKAAGSCWIVGVMGWILLPLLHRFTAAATAGTEQRVLAALDDVELVVTQSGDGLQVSLRPGERLLLRRRI